MLSTLGRTAKTAEFLAHDPVLTAKAGQTPHEIIHRQGKAAVRYFAPDPGTEGTHQPVFVSMPLINTWTVWDLLPGRSVVAKLNAAGVPVYLLDWGRPGDEDAERPLSYYVDEVMGRALHRSKRHARAHHDTEGFDAIGYCVGGTFLSVFLARNPDAVRSAAFVCTPIDFHASGRLAAWTKPDRFPLDTLIDSVGNYPADLMRTSFQWLKPSGQTAKWMGLWSRIEDEGFQELWATLEQWNADNVDFPGEAYREYVRRCYFDNALMHGGWTLGRHPVDLGQAQIPAMVIAAPRDHIAPQPACWGLQDAWGGEVEVQLLSGGHVGVSVSSRLPKALIAWLDKQEG
jgi:polyhydroxyalkanoate synthase